MTFIMTLYMKVYFFPKINLGGEDKGKVVTREGGSSFALFVIVVR